MEPCLKSWLSKDGMKQNKGNERMTQEQYLDLLTQVYRQANLADTEYAQEWQNADDASKHCRAIETVVYDLIKGKEYQTWLDNI